MVAFVPGSGISVVLCAYTEVRWDALVAAVDSVWRQTLMPAQVIVVVDHNPALYARAQQQFSGAVVIENQERRGLSGARNSGVAVADGALIAFLDDDACAAPDWLERLAAAFADSQVVGAGGAIVPHWVTGRPAWFPDEFDWVVGCTYRGLPRQSAVVRNVIGCNMAFRREVFAAIGGFRIGRVGVLSIGQENDETEFCIRLKVWDAQAQMLYVPAAVVVHCVTESRTTLGYFLRRCFSEGMSKAALARQVGRSRGLAAERRYTMHTLPRGVLRHGGTAFFDHDWVGLVRAGMIVVGLAVTLGGYVVGMVVRRRGVSVSSGFSLVDPQAARPPISSVH